MPFSLTPLFWKKNRYEPKVDLNSPRIDASINYETNNSQEPSDVYPGVILKTKEIETVETRILNEMYSRIVELFKDHFGEYGTSIVIRNIKHPLRKKDAEVPSHFLVLSKSISTCSDLTEEIDITLPSHILFQVKSLIDGAKLIQSGIITKKTIIELRQLLDKELLHKDNEYDLWELYEQIIGILPDLEA